MGVKLLTEHHLEFLSLKGGCTCSSESTHVKMPHCWKSHANAQMFKPMDKDILTILLPFFVGMNFYKVLHISFQYYKWRVVCILKYVIMIILKHSLFIVDFSSV